MIYNFLLLLNYYGIINTFVATINYPYYMPICVVNFFNSKWFFRNIVTCKFISRSVREHICISNTKPTFFLYMRGLISKGWAAKTNGTDRQTTKQIFVGHFHDEIT